MFNGRKDVYEFDGTIKELYLLLDISPTYYKDGVRKKTINELLRIKPLFTPEGYEVPRVLVVKNKVKKLKVISSNRLRYAKYYYKRNRTERIDDQYDESFLVYMDKLARMFPKKLISATELVKRKALKNKKALPKGFAKASRVALKKVNHISSKYKAVKFAKGSNVSLRPKLVLKNRPKKPTKVAHLNTIKKLKFEGPKSKKPIFMANLKYTKKPKTKVRSATASPQKAKSKASVASKPKPSTKKPEEKKKASKSSGGLKMSLGVNKGARVSAPEAKYSEVKTINIKYELPKVQGIKTEPVSAPVAAILQNQQKKAQKLTEPIIKQEIKKEQQPPLKRQELEEPDPRLLAMLRSLESNEFEGGM